MPRTVAALMSPATLLLAGGRMGPGWWLLSWHPMGDPPTPTSPAPGSSWPTLTETLFLGGGDVSLISWIYCFWSPVIIRSRARGNRGAHRQGHGAALTAFQLHFLWDLKIKGTRYIWANRLLLWKKEDLEGSVPTLSCLPSGTCSTYFLLIFQLPTQIDIIFCLVKHKRKEGEINNDFVDLHTDTSITNQHHEHCNHHHHALLLKMLPCPWHSLFFGSHRACAARQGAQSEK